MLPQSYNPNPKNPSPTSVMAITPVLPFRFPPVKIPVAITGCTLQSPRSPLFTTRHEFPTPIHCIPPNACSMILPAFSVPNSLNQYIISIPIILLWVMLRLLMLLSPHVFMYRRRRRAGPCCCCCCFVNMMGGPHALNLRPEIFRGAHSLHDAQALAVNLLQSGRLLDGLVII